MPRFDSTATLPPNLPPLQRQPQLDIQNSKRTVSYMPCTPAAWRSRGRGGWPGRDSKPAAPWGAPPAAAVQGRCGTWQAVAPMAQQPVCRWPRRFELLPQLSFGTTPTQVKVVAATQPAQPGPHLRQRHRRLVLLLNPQAERLDAADAQVSRLKRGEGRGTRNPKAG